MAMCVVVNVTHPTNSHTIKKVTVKMYILLVITDYSLRLELQGLNG
jgi:hypothetical protein